MNIGLLGAHRTGKSTLAQAYAEQADISMALTGATEIFAALGLDPKAEYPIGERLAIQEAILYGFEAHYAFVQKERGGFIADRTPLDLAAYMIADVQRRTLDGSPEIAILVNDYVRRCIESTNRWFSTVLLVQPGIKLVEAPGKAPACPAFIEHMNLIGLGLLNDERLMCKHYFIPRRYTDLQQRVECIQNATQHSYESTVAAQKVRQAVGIRLH